jgi:hypothetical protein
MNIYTVKAYVRFLDLICPISKPVPPSPYPTQGKGNSVHARWDASFYRSLDVLPSFLELVALIVVVTCALLPLHLEPQDLPPRKW